MIRGYLGVTIQSVEYMADPPEEVQEGAYVVEIHPDTPAARSDIEAGDVIVGFGDDPVGSAEELTAHVTDTKPGSKVDLTVVRGGEEKIIEVLVGSLPREYEQRMVLVPGCCGRRPCDPDGGGLRVWKPEQTRSI